MFIYTCFPQGKFKVLTMSYDDGKLEDRKLVEIFNKYNIKGTFHINSGLFDQDIRIDANEVADLYAGHEVACHTLTHPTIARCPLETIVKEIFDDRINLEKLTGSLVQGLSYPNGSYSKEIENLLPSLGIKYSRTINSTGTFELPENLFEWNPTCHHNEKLLELGKEFIEFNKKQFLKMMYVWGHSFEFSNRNNWELIEDFCKLMSNHDDIWYATNIEYVNYMEAAKRLVFSADTSFVHNPSAMSVWISIDNKEVVEIPGRTTVKLT